MKNFYALLGKTAHKTHETVRSYGSSFGNVARNQFFLILILFNISFRIQAQIAMPYTETFSSITAANGFPTVPGGAWTRSGTTTLQPTYIANQTTYNRSGNGDTKFISFRYGQTAGNVYCVGPFALTAGVTYQTSILYKADGLTGFGPLSLTYGNAATLAAQTNTIASVGANITNLAYSTLSGSFTPATSGNYYIGVKCVANSTPWYLTCDDFNFAVLPGCSGTPNAGVATLSSSSGCLGASVNVSATGITTGSGISYQWQSSTNGTTWSDIVGATSSTYTATPSVTTYYRLVTTCTNSGLTNTSSSIMYTLNCYQMGASGASITACSGTLYDNGGAADYGNSLNSTITIYPATAGNMVNLNFSAFATENNWDGLVIYNGNSTAAPIISSGLAAGTGSATNCPAGSYYGTVSPGTVVSTALDGSLTLQFRSDGSGVAAGFVASISCSAPPACSAPTSLASGSITGTSATISWTAASPAPASGYEYYVSTSSTAPTAGTTPTGSTAAGVTSASITGLSGVTTYYYWVRSNCGGSGTSSWSSSATFTTLCGLNTVVLNMFDSWGDGWNGATYTLVNNGTSATVATGTMSSGSSASVTFCLSNGCYQFSTSNDSFGEKSWNVSVNGVATLSGNSAASSDVLSVNSTCGIPGCMDPASDNYNPAATVDNGSCVYLCASAVALTCGTATNYNNSAGNGAWNSLGGPYGTPGTEQLFTYTPTASGNYTISVTSSAWNDLYYSTSCGSTGWTYVDDISGSATNTLALTGGTTYYFLLDPEGTAGVSGTITASCYTPPAWTDAWVSMNTGSSNWCAGETRTISVTVTNTGSSTWTNATPDINIGVKWNADADYFVRTDANGLAPGATQTYNLTVTAPMTTGTNNLTFDIVNELNFWFANNTNGGGPGNVVYTSPAITINGSPTVMAGNDVTICNGQSTTLNGAVLSNSSVSSSPGVAIPDNNTTGVSTTIAVSGAAVTASQITGVTVNISHTWDSDLSLTLIAPNGSSIDLSSGNGGSGDNYTNTYFTTSGTGITLGTAPFTGSYMPEVPFSSLTGSANGTWTLKAVDAAVGDVGTINSLSITYGVTAPTATYSWAPSTTLNNGSIATPIATPNSTTTYTLTGSLNGCSSTDAVVVTLPTAGTALSQNNESATCVVNQNGWVHFYHSSGRLIGSINSQGQDLGSVTATSYVEGAPVSVDACTSSNPIYATTVMGRHWVITPTNQPTTPVLVRFPYSNTEFSDLTSAASTNANSNDDLFSPSDLGMTKYSNGTAANVNNIASDNCGVGSSTFHTQMGNGAASTYSAVSANYVDFSIPGFSEFWLHGSSAASPLPVELVSFQANCVGEGKVNVTWATASEHNSANFTVEKSRDGINWTVLSTVAGAGISTQMINYSIMDNNAASGVNYYRLTQTDFDGVSETFNIASANCGENSTVTTVKVYPNPSAGDFYIDFNSEEITGEGMITITDARGTQVYVKEVKIEKGSNVFHVQLDAAPGMYYIRVSNKTQTSNIVKHSLR